MLNNRLNKSDDNKVDHLKPSLDGPSHASTIDLSRPSADFVDEKPAQRASTTALSTSHDAVLAELHGRGIGMRMKEILATENPPPGGGRLNNPYRAGSTDFPATSEPLFDPFSGALIGDLEAEQGPGATNDEDLWTHLSKILRLQSDIAEMHIKMEGIGLKPGAAPDKSKGGVNRRPSTSGTREWSAADEGVDEEADEEAENNRKREAEFSRLTDKFAGRKDAIDEIMKNLDELSSALTTFHGLRTPIIDFQSNSKSASNTSSRMPSTVKPVPQPPTTPIPPNTPPSAPVTMSSPGKQKRQHSSKVTPLFDKTSSAFVDSPDSMKATLPDEHAR